MAKIKLLASLALTVLSFSPVKVSAAGPITCLTSTNLENVVDCLDKHTVPAGFYNEDEYNAAQPTASEIIAWNAAITNMLTVGCPPGTPATGTPVPGLLLDYTIARITDGTYTWCILSESNTHPRGQMYRRGWGFVVTPADPVNGVRRDLHFSAPHPKSDENTPQQAAALFKYTGANSLVVTGRHREAYAIPSLCSDTYYKTDAAHDDNEPFYLALKQVAAWKDSNGGCNWACCAYLQIHGMKTTTCPDFVFMSSGRGNTDSSVTCYGNPLLPISRLKNELLSTFGPPIGTPSVPPSCDLTATRNIFGRLVSGIPASAVCGNTPSIPCVATGSTCAPGTAGCMGKFVHIEQDPDFRLDTNYGKWINAINAAFPPRAQCPTNLLEGNAFKVQS